MQPSIYPYFHREIMCVPSCMCVRMYACGFSSSEEYCGILSCHLDQSYSYINLSIDR